MGYEYKTERMEEEGIVDVFFHGPLKGFDSENTDLEVAEGFVPVLQFVNLPLGSPEFVNGYSLLDTTFDMRDDAKPMGYGQYKPTSGTDLYIFIQADGEVVYYDTGTDAMISLFDKASTQFFTASEQWEATQLLDYLIFVNRANGCWKYDGSNFLPLGAMIISDCEADHDGQWAGETAESSVVMEGLQSYSSGDIGTGANTTLTFTPTANLDLSDAPGTATAYTKTNAKFGFFIHITDASEFDEAASYLEVATASGSTEVQLDFDDANMKDKATGVKVVFADNTWFQIEVAISDMTETGTFDLADVDTVKFYLENDGGAGTTVYLDCIYIIYTTQLPAANFCATWKSMLIVGDTIDDRTEIAFTKSGSPDQYDALAFLPVSQKDGGNVTGLHRYFNQVYIGKTNTSHSLGGSLAGTLYPGYNLEVLDVSTEYGCDSHRAIVEALGKLYFPWQDNICTYDGTVVNRVQGLYRAETGDFEETLLNQKVGAYSKTLDQIWWSWPKNGGTTNTELIKFDTRISGFIGPHTALTANLILEAIFIGYQGGRETLIGIDTGGDVMNLDDSSAVDADGTSIVSVIRYPWTSGGLQEQLKQWLEIYFSFEDQSTGAITVQYRTADSPREMPDASFSSISPTLDQTAAGERGRLFIGVTSRWIQIQVTTTGVKYNLQHPWHLMAVPLGMWT